MKLFKTLFVSTLLLMCCGFHLLGGYTPAPPNQKAFTAEWKIDANVRVEIAEILVDWVRTRASEVTPLNDADWTLISRSMALSKVLQSSNKGFIVADYQLGGNVPVTSPKRLLTGKEASDLLLQVCKSGGLQNDLTKDGIRFYSFILELAASLNPANEEAIIEYSTLQNEKGANDWQLLLPAVDLPFSSAISPAPSTPPGGETAQGQGGINKEWTGPRSQEIKVFLSNDKADKKDLTYNTAFLSITASPNTSKRLFGIFERFSMPTTPPTPTPYVPQTGAFPGNLSNPGGTYPHHRDYQKDISFAVREALQQVTQKHPEIENWPGLRFSFKSENENRDGRGQALPVALLTLSLVEGFKIDPALVVSGDLTIDGSIQGSVATEQKVNCAIKEGAKGMMLSSEAREALMEMMMDKPDFLKKIQIFGVHTVDEARNVARTDKPENIQKAWSMFEELQKTDSFSQEKVDEIVKVAPSHLSAKLLADQYRGRLSKTLSVNISVQKIMGAAPDFVSFMVSNQAADMSQGRNSRMVVPPVRTPLTFETSRAELEKISRKIDPKTQDFHSAVSALLDAWESAQSMLGKMPSGNIRRQLEEANSNFYIKWREATALQRAESGAGQ